MFLNYQWFGFLFAFKKTNVYQTLFGNGIHVNK